MNLANSVVSVQRPPCADWDIWKGPEVEGAAHVGVATLFIRSLSRYPRITPADDLSFLRTTTGCNRVWFCKEFRDWSLLNAIRKYFDETCLEVRAQDIQSVPKRLLKHCRIYVKVDLPIALKAGDHVCVGVPYADEAWEVGTGNKVRPEQYLNDIRIV